MHIATETATEAQRPFPPPIDWTALRGTDPPPRSWAVKCWVPMGCTTLLAGPPGLGKTLCAQTLATCLALGRDYFDEIPEPRTVLFWAGEDDADELHRRQVDICDWLQADMGELAGRFWLHSCVGTDITLAQPIQGILSPTSKMTELRRQVDTLKPDVVMLDSTARVFGGNENDRHHTTLFINMLDAAAQGAAVILLSHPAKAAGSEFSGSTAWEASVRSRLFLSATLPDAEPDEDGIDADSTRYLSRRKANYSGKDWRRFEYRNGVLVPEDSAPKTRYGPQYSQDVVRRALRKLRELEMVPTHSTASSNYLPKLAGQYGMLDGISKKEFAAAMRTLVMEKKLRADVVGTYSNRTARMGLVEVERD
ncbi:MAG: AAA family ATPase [Dehalococcoidia bacterium]